MSDPTPNYLEFFPENLLKGASDRGYLSPLISDCISGQLCLFSPPNCFTILFTLYFRSYRMVLNCTSAEKLCDYLEMTDMPHELVPPYGEHLPFLHFFLMWQAFVFSQHSLPNTF